MNPLNEKIEALGKGLGAAQVGFADLSSLPDGLNQGYPAAVSIVVRLSKGILAQMEDAPTATYFSHYRIVNRLIDEITLRVALALEEGGAMAVAVPASQSLPSVKGENPYRGLFAHKTARGSPDSGHCRYGLDWEERSVYPQGLRPRGAAGNRTDRRAA